MVQSQPSGDESAQDSGDDCGLQERSTATSPLAIFNDSIPTGDILKFHNLQGPKVVNGHQLGQEEDSAEAVISETV